MIRLIRVIGTLLIIAGALVLASYLIEPLRELWPWFLELPLPVRIGLGAAAVGFIILLGTVIWERYEDVEKERDLQDDY